MDKPIPAFYCCYLLRSTVRHTSLYVGSTPHILRRWKQHNGISKGGAARTNRDTLRPWEVTCIVYGFPSQIAALQFEWAWQNPHLTRHIPKLERITQARTSVRISPRTGKARKRPAKPRVSLTDKIANLHALLGSKSFERWPLSLHFFSTDAYRVWQVWVDRTGNNIRPDIQVDLDPLASAAAVNNNNNNTRLSDSIAGEVFNDLLPISIPPALEAIDVGYTTLKSHLEKAKAILESGAKLSCTVCTSTVNCNSELALVCPHDSCSSVSHLSCLAREFVVHESTNESILPLSGHCPGCRKSSQWSTLIKEISIRTRGHVILNKLFKVSNRKRGAKHTVQSSSPGQGEATLESDDNNDGSDDGNNNDEWIFRNYDSDELDTQNGFMKTACSDEDDGLPGSQNTSGSTAAPILVIEDSDWEGAEILD